MTGPLTARISSFRYPFCVVTRPTWAKELTPLPQITASKTPSPNTEPMVIRWQGFAASLYRSSPRRCNIHCVTTGASRSPRFSLKFQYSRFTLFLSAFLPSKVFDCAIRRSVCQFQSSLLPLSYRHRYRLSNSRNLLCRSNSRSKRLFPVARYSRRAFCSGREPPIRFSSAYFLVSS